MRKLIKYILGLSLIVIGNFSFAQTEEIYTRVEKMPEFPGGQVALVKYISKNLKYPKTSKKDKISGSVSVAFIVTKSGKVSNAEITKSLNPDCDAEALRVVQKMPSWKPGEKDGRPVAVQFNLPINFDIGE